MKHYLLNKVSAASVHGMIVVSLQRSLYRCIVVNQSASNIINAFISHELVHISSPVCSTVQYSPAVNFMIELGE